MGTKVLKLENKKHGSYQFETIDPKGNKHGFNGVIHEFESRTRKSHGHLKWRILLFTVQLEFLEFEKLTDDTSKLNIQMVYRSGRTQGSNAATAICPGNKYGA